MISRPLPNWPLAWNKLERGNEEFPVDQSGLLKYVYANSRLSNRCFLVAEYDNEKYVCSLVFDDKAFCNQVTTLLKRHIGHAIFEIGDLEIPVDPAGLYQARKLEPMFAERGHKNG